MKNILKVLSICLLANFAFGQTTLAPASAQATAPQQKMIFLTRSLKVQPTNVPKLLQLLDSTYTANPIPGISVSLFQVYSRPADMEATHQLLYYGSQADMAKYLDMSLLSESSPWAKFNVQRDALASSVGGHQTGRIELSYGDTGDLPLGVITLLEVPREKASSIFAAFKTWNDQFGPKVGDGQRNTYFTHLHGRNGVTVGYSSRYKDYQTMFNAPQSEARDNFWNQIVRDHFSGTRTIATYSRWLVKSWAAK